MAWAKIITDEVFAIIVQLALRGHSNSMYVRPEGGGGLVKKQTKTSNIFFWGGDGDRKIWKIGKFERTHNLNVP